VFSLFFYSDSNIKTGALEYLNFDLPFLQTTMFIRCYWCDVGVLASRLRWEGQLQLGGLCCGYWPVFM